MAKYLVAAVCLLALLGQSAAKAASHRRLLVINQRPVCACPRIYMPVCASGRFDAVFAPASCWESCRMVLADGELKARHLALWWLKTMLCVLVQMDRRTATSARQSAGVQA